MPVVPFRDVKQRSVMEECPKMSEIPRKSRVYCSVFGCDSRASTDPTVTFHSFPDGKKLVSVENIFGSKDVTSKRKMWMKVLRMEKTKPFMRVCSKHFKKYDFFLSNSQLVIPKRRLKETAIPSLNLPPVLLANKSSETKVGGQVRRKRSAEKLKTDECGKKAKPSVENLCTSDFHSIGTHVSTTDKSENLSVSQPADELNLEQSEHVVSTGVTDEVDDEDPDVLDGFTNPMTCNVDLPQFANVGTQTDIIGYKFIDTITTNADLSTLTGISNFETLEALIDVVKMVDPVQHGKLSIKERIVLTMVKLKHNCSYSFLSIIFKCCTSRNCLNVVHSMLDVLSVCLSYAIKWPSREEISRNLPLCFNNFENVRAVIDCTEIPIQKPENLCCEIIAFSNYKGYDTLKLMTVVTPSTTLSFKSELYGGRVSDTEIFKQSGLIDLLEPGDALMMDKGFLIDEICRERNIEIVRPAFLAKKKQFAKEEALTNQSISSARVHVERYNQRMKEFRCLGEKMPSSLVPKSEQIVTVICGLVNLSAPLLKDDKFFSD